MTTEIATQDEIILTVINEHVVATSNKVAEHFKKTHKNVLQAIDNLECSDEFRRLNFQPTFQTVALPNGASRQDRSFTITRDGFSFLGMGFTGKEAAAWKEKYIKSYNAQEKEIQRLYAQNQALLKSQLTNCHGAIDTLQVDNGLDRAKEYAVVWEERLSIEKLDKKLASLEKKIELEKVSAEAAAAWDKARMQTEDSKWKNEAKRLEQAIVGRDQYLAVLEERMTSLETIFGVDRDADLADIKKLLH